MCRTRKEYSKRKSPAGKISLVERRGDVDQINLIVFWAAEERILRIVP